MISPEARRRKWDGFIKRLQAEAAKTLHSNISSGVAVITVHVAMTPDGELMLWAVKDGIRIEPSKDAAAALSALVGG